jgi:hypothetical protein
LVKIEHSDLSGYMRLVLPLEGRALVGFGSELAYNEIFQFTGCCHTKLHFDLIVAKIRQLRPRLFGLFGVVPGG